MTAVSTVAKREYKFETLSVTEAKQFVYHVAFNRPDRLNAFNRTMWFELGKCFNDLSYDSNCRAIVLSANGKHYTAGLDLTDAMKIGQELGELDDVARKANYLEQKIKAYQDSISSLEKCQKPVIVAVHSACVGAGVNVIAAADIRYCTEDAWFTVKEVDIGLAADVGALQRLPKIIKNQSLVRELCFTARKFDSKEAYDNGVVSRVFKTKDEMINAAIQLAELIASKSPVAVQATKRSLVYSLDHTNQEGLDHICEINKTNLQSEDFINATIAGATKGDPPVFAKL
ncbi:Delta(3,5)-Delta(2,4)-dienoyl-CoA isomerase, mitochondrial [Pseudolycoriella hygida]|uniref:Delta(3,5)-Delta(2,4)-dienoyl-CoA isomerase, mitochondrial n=1 Tax=Pseudolycoriella hygida TaxID=35572 RepID=A0A9Q0MZP7_9DIPT|nr:Delta(3,5)-Delta(2,4)-dienoyl-CoA isomerase, mitochondrial [Pseudolycoriella hygida]